MTSRERLLAAARGGACDRIPWAPELNHAFVARVLAGARVERGRDYIEACKRLGAECLRGVQPWELVMHGVDVERVREGNTTTILWRTPVGELRCREETRSAAEATFEVEHRIRSLADLRVYRWVMERAEVVPGDASGGHATVSRAIEQMGDDGLISLTGPATPLMGLLMTDLRAPAMHYLLADHEQEVAALFERMHALNCRAYHLLAALPGEIVRPFEDTSTSLMSPAMYRRYCQPYLREYGEIVRAGGKLFVPHLCGLLRNALPDLRDTAIDGIEALTPPDTGDTPLPLARRALGPTCVLIGGLDPAWFSLIGPAEMRRRLAGIRAEIGSGRFTILGNEEISVRANLETVSEVPRVLEERGAVPFGGG